MDAHRDAAADRVAAGLIDRREAVRRVTALLGGVALVGGDALLTGCAPDRRRGGDGDIDFAADDVALLDEIAETILPETSTPGARAAATGAFMALSVRDVYSLEDQRVFLDGMRELQDRCRAMHGTGFMQASPSQRLALLEQLDREQHAYMRAREAARRGEPGTRPDVTADAPAHWFRMMKELALLGYFTSEIGYHQAQQYVETPGRYDPCVPYQPGERAWAPHA
jgi:hypothetical protein